MKPILAGRGAHASSIIEASRAANDGPDSQLARVIAGTLGVAGLLVATSLAGLVLRSTYARETANWTAQAIAQDWFDLIVAVPALCLAALWARRSLRGQLVLAGAVLFAAYTLAIYAFAVHLNSAFLIYCAGLGVSLYTLIGVGRAVDLDEVASHFDQRVPRRAVAGFLIAVGLAFASLWLMQLIPAFVTGREPTDLAETGLLTNPIHVLDLSFVLPLHVIAGVALLRGRPLGYVLAPIILAFGVLMAASIAVLTIFMDLRGVTSGSYPVTIAMTCASAIAGGLLVGMLRSLRNERCSDD